MAHNTPQSTVNLTDEQMAQYERDGFLIIEDLVSQDEVRALRDRVSEYTHGGRDHGSLRVQVEPKVTRGEMKVDHPGDAIRKIEGLVDYDDLYQALGLHPNIVGVIEQILGPDIKMFRNAMLCKPPRVGSAKEPHQDSPYWPIEPMSLCSCWFAIDDATLDNGCMRVIPGAHKLGALKHVGEGDFLEIEPGQYDRDSEVAAPMRAGSGLFFHSLLPHYTAPNNTDNWRRAIALSYMSSRSKYTGEGESPVYFHVKGETFPGCVQ